MTASVYVNAAKDKIVEPGPEAAYKIHVKDAKRLGLLKEPKPEKAETNGEVLPRAPRRAPAKRDQ